MRSNGLKMLLSVCLVWVLTGWGVTYAGELAKEEQIAPEGRRFEPGPEQIDKMLEQLKQSNPQKADELIQLREKDPEAFKMEIRKVMREQFGKQMREQMGRPDKEHQGPKHGEQPWMGRGGPEMMREWMKEKHEEYIKWLETNYPAEAAKLKELKDEDPEQYMRAVMNSGRKYWPIFFASKDNPQMAAILKEQLPLKERRAELLKQIRATTDEKQKKELTAELEKVVNKQFDLIVKKKQLAYEDLTKKLEELKKEVDNKKAEVEKWKSGDFKSQKVKERVTELLNEKEKFEWES